MPLLNIKQQTPEWHEIRRKGIGASDAPIILGVSPYKTPRQLWEEKLLLKEPPKKTDSQQRGNDLEEMVRELFIEATGIKVSPAFYLHDEIDWMFSSFDGLSNDQRLIVEIKCPNREDHELAKQRKVPVKYYPQTQHQFNTVPQANHLMYVSWFDKDLQYFEVSRDQVFIEKMFEKEKEFIGFMRSFTAPPLTDRDVIERLDDRWYAISQRYRELAADQLRIEKEITDVRNELIKEANGFNTKGFGTSITKVLRKGNVDYEKIPELKGIDIEKYRRQSLEYWKIIADSD